MPFVIGETIGPYRLIEQLGQGGMATVFKAYHAALDRYVAIKALHPAFTQEENFLARFRREAQVVARLEHPNIVPIYDFAEHEGRPYLVMKFIEGETLKARLSRGPLDQQELIQIVESVGKALEYAHQQGILHRDVKPSNVLLAKDGHIYLADFGLARIAQAGESTISSDVMLGTPQYISPEQATGKRDLDNGTDIYSFGVLLYELLVGHVPYNADTPFSIIHDHIYTPLPMPRLNNPSISEAAERVLLKALAKERTDRFSSVADMVEALTQALQAGPGTVSPLPVIPAATTVSNEQLTIALASERTPPPADFGPTATDVLVQSQPLPKAQPVQEAPPPKAPGKSKRTGWIVAGICVLLILCAIGLLTAFPRLRQRLLRLGAPLGPRQAETMRAPGGAVSPPGQPAQQPVATMAPPPIPPTRALEDLRQRAAENPDDPNAHFELGLAYLEARMPAEAEQEFDLALTAARDDPELFKRLGDQFFGRERWFLAARAYLRAASLVPPPLPPDFMDRLNQSLYLAAQDPGMRRFLQAAPVEPVDPIVMEIVSARYALYQGDLQGAEKALKSLSENEAQHGLVKLLEAEILNAKGEPEQAKTKLEPMLGDPDIPEWIRFLAEYLLKILFSTEENMRTPFVAGNWKMFKTVAEARRLVSELVPNLQAIKGVEKVLCPPSTSLLAVAALLEGTDIGLGAQNMHWELSGAYTGEIAAPMVAEFCHYVILGHSERRKYFGESDETVNRKVKTALANGLIPIMCVGETLEENEAGHTAEVVSRQVRLGLAGIDTGIAHSIVVAYEPVWAIGTGRASTAAGAKAVVADVIRPALASLFNSGVAQAVRVLYGGSVTGSNAAEYFAEKEIDGALVGGASLKVADFTQIVKAAVP